MSVGKPIFAIADGYVSRITVGLYGFGNALYITHPDGHSSVYCHLNGFVPSIRVKLSNYRKKNGQPDELAEWRKSPQVPADVYFRPYEIPVSRGQLVAVSGNTGSSMAPHLHLEVHDTQDWAMRDPLTYVSQYLTDTTPPQAHAFTAVPNRRITASALIIWSGSSMPGAKWVSDFGPTIIWKAHSTTTAFITPN